MPNWTRDMIFFLFQAVTSCDASYNSQMSLVGVCLRKDFIFQESLWMFTALHINFNRTLFLLIIFSPFKSPIYAK